MVVLFPWGHNRRQRRWRRDGKEAGGWGRRWERVTEEENALFIQEHDDE